MKQQIIFKCTDFEEMMTELYPLWRLPRYGNQIRPRKHGIESSFIGTFNVLRGGCTLLQTEQLCGIDQSLIHIDVYRNCGIINEILDYEISWPSKEEQLFLVQLNPDFNSCIVVDCMDIATRISYTDWYNFLYKSWKVKQGYRNLLAVDLKGEIRGVTSIPCGYNNDQFVLWISKFFRKGSLAECTTALGDGGFTGDQDFRMDRPFTIPQLRMREELKEYNRLLNKHKCIVERVNGILKMQWRVFQKKWVYTPTFFPAAFRTCCILTNRYFRLYGYPGNES